MTMDKETLSEVIELCDKTTPPLNGLRAAMLMAQSLSDTLDRDAMNWAIEQIYGQLEEVQELHNRMHQIGLEDKIGAF